MSRVIEVRHRPTTGELVEWTGEKSCLTDVLEVFGNVEDVDIGTFGESLHISFKRGGPDYYVKPGQYVGVSRIPSSNMVSLMVVASEDFDKCFEVVP